MLRRLSAFACAWLVAACSLGPLLLVDHPLAGKIWDARAGKFVSAEEATRRALGARHVLLGETHDNPEHHRLQRAMLESLVRNGPGRVLAMEQFDAEHQGSIDEARGKGADADAIAQAGRIDRGGWDWALYRPLVEVALAHGWRLAAANLSRADARTIVRHPASSKLPPADPSLREALEHDMVAGHCGRRPDPATLAGLIEAQRARDAQLARTLSGDPAGGVLIAGNGHVRRDRGAPLYLPDADLVAIGFVEVERGKEQPQDYFADGFATMASYDYLWFTPRTERPDPCTSAATLPASTKR